MKNFWPLSYFRNNVTTAPFYVVRQSLYYPLPLYSLSLCYLFVAPGIPGLQAAEVKRESCHVTNYFGKNIENRRKTRKVPGRTARIAL